MTKGRLMIGTGLVGVLASLSAMALPATAASADDASGGSAGTTSSGPLLTVCLTVNPKSISISVNGITIGSASSPNVPRTCVSTPF